MERMEREGVGWMEDGMEMEDEGGGCAWASGHERARRIHRPTRLSALPRTLPR